MPMESLNFDARLAESIAMSVLAGSRAIATATLITSTRAVMPAVKGQPPRRLSLGTAEGSIYTAYVILNKANLPAVLDVVVPLEQYASLAHRPPLKEDCECSWGGKHAKGLIMDDEGGFAVRFPSDLLPETATGAPVVAGGELVGILDHPLTKGIWRLTSSRAIEQALMLAERQSESPPAFSAQSSSAPQPQVVEVTPPDNTPTFDEKSFFARLHPSARTALGYAAASAEGKVNIEDLIWGLYCDLEGTTHRLINAKKMEAAFLVRLLVDATERGASRFTRAEPIDLTALPERTERVQNVFVSAARIADERGSRQIRGRHLLFAALSQEGSPVIGNLRSQGITADAVQLTDTHSIIGHRADTADGPDLLNITSEARAIASVLAASKVEPPISVGLFGEWGSGKSFFMREMHRQFEEIEKSGDENYCKNIIQIWFNAWHYIDANLWASLAAEVFERLDAELTQRSVQSEKDQRDKDRAVLLAENAQSRSKLEQAAREQQDLEDELKRIQSSRDDLGDERKVAASLGLRSVFTAAVEAVETTPAAKTIRDEIGKAKDSLKVDDKTLREARGVAGAAKVAWKSRPARVTVLLLILLVGLILTAPFLAEYLKSFLFVPALAAIAGLIKYLPSAIKGLGAIGRAWRIKENLIAKERTRRLEQLETREHAVEERLAQSKKNYESAALAIESNEAEMARLEPQRQISTFIHERRKSTDYTKHLGVIAAAHDDFEHLSTLLSKSRGTKSEANVPTIDRIILYIDDLDRCPEDKVVDVLQAVHLLLAFPLFVVVVGVDSRWLLHSLQRHLKQFTVLEDDEKDELSQALWESTPINYLEKIFQIPFTIRPMRSTAFGTLIDNLALPQDRVGEAKKEPQQTSDAITPPSAPPDASPLQRLMAATKQRLVPPPPPLPDAPLPRPASPPTSIEYLTLQKWETDFMKLLYPLIPSPRAAKRFANIYRLMRGMIDEYERPAFSGTEDAQGYRAALLMLAMLAGHPEEASDILQELVTTKPSNDWWTFVDGYVGKRSVEANANERWTKLKDRLLQVERPANRPAPPCEIFIRWAPDVARFSFYSGRVFATRP